MGVLVGSQDGVARIQLGGTKAWEGWGLDTAGTRTFIVHRTVAANEARCWCEGPGLSPAPSLLEMDMSDVDDTGKMSGYTDKLSEGKPKYHHRAHQKQKSTTYLLPPGSGACAPLPIPPKDPVYPVEEPKKEESPTEREATS